MRKRILDAAADLLREEGIGRVGTAALARAVEVRRRTVTALARDRVGVLRLVVEHLPFPPTAEQFRRRATVDPPTAAILGASATLIANPASGWDPIEVQALALAPYDADLRQVLRNRLAERWAVASGVIAALREAGGVDVTIDTDAATLHLLAVGLGVAVLDDLAPRRVDDDAWLALSARLIESLASLDVPDGEGDAERVPWRLRVAIPRGSASVARLLRIMALHRIEVVALFLGAADRGDGDAVDMFVRAPRDLTREALEQVLLSVATQAVAAPGRAEDSVDIATRVLEGAAALIEDPDLAPAAAAMLVLADSWRVQPAVADADTSPTTMRLQWTPDRHVVLHRARVPFTRVERSRASALLGLVAAVASVREDQEEYGWLEFVPGKGTVSVRLARPSDAEAVAALHGRCSDETLLQRYFTPVSTWRDEYLRRLSGGHRGATLVVADLQGNVVGLGNVFPSEAGDSAAAEVALLIEDSYQGRGIGGPLLRHLLELAERLGFDEAVAYVLPGNSRMLSVLARSGRQWTESFDEALGPRVVRASTPLR